MVVGCFVLFCETIIVQPTQDFAFNTTCSFLRVKAMTKIKNVCWVTLYCQQSTIIGAKYSRIDQVKFVENSLQKIWRVIVKGYGLPKANHTPSSFLKAVFHKFWILCINSATAFPIPCCNFSFYRKHNI